MDEKRGAGRMKRIVAIVSIALVSLPLAVLPAAPASACAKASRGSAPSCPRCAAMTVTRPGLPDAGGSSASLRPGCCRVSTSRDVTAPSAVGAGAPKPHHAPDAPFANPVTAIADGSPTMAHGASVFVAASPPRTAPTETTHLRF